jgi:hypothetical protein
VKEKDRVHIISHLPTVHKAQMIGTLAFEFQRRGKKKKDEEEKKKAALEQYTRVLNLD